MKLGTAASTGLSSKALLLSSWPFIFKGGLPVLNFKSLSLAQAQFFSLFHFQFSIWILAKNLNLAEEEKMGCSRSDQLLKFLTCHPSWRNLHLLMKKNSKMFFFQDFASTKFFQQKLRSQFYFWKNARNVKDSLNRGTNLRSFGLCWFPPPSPTLRNINFIFY